MADVEDILKWSMVEVEVGVEGQEWMETAIRQVMK